MLSGRRLDVHVLDANLEKLGDLAADFVAVGTDLRSLRQHRYVGVSDTQTLTTQHLEYVTDEDLTISTLPSRIGVFEVLSDIAQACGSEESIAQRMQYHV